MSEVVLGIDEAGDRPATIPARSINAIAGRPVRHAIHCRADADQADDCNDEREMLQLRA